jgi:hypothetical protein
MIAPVAALRAALIRAKLEPSPFRGGVLRKGRPPRTSATPSENPSDSTGFLILLRVDAVGGMGPERCRSGHDKIVLETAQGAWSSRYVDGLDKMRVRADL